MFRLTVFNMSNQKWTTHSSHSTLEEAQKSFVSLAQKIDANCEIPSEITNFSNIMLEDKIIQLVYSEKKADKTDYSKIILRGNFNGAYVEEVYIDEEETQDLNQIKTNPIIKDLTNEETNQRNSEKEQIQSWSLIRQNGI